MSDPPDQSALPDRPAPPRSVRERALTWLEWVGVGRVVGTAVVVLAVLAAAYWLVRPPAATVESRLPFVSSATTGATTRQDGSDATSIGTPASVSTPTTSGEVVVHVAGAVVASGVYRLAIGSRVVDAVQLAGGLAANADADAVNLAAVLQDGERVYVPRVGEPAPPLVDPGGPSTVPPPVDLNRATADELDGLPGVGPATAAAIVRYRDEHGPFGSVDDLAGVRGIGPAKVEALRGLVTT